MERTSYLLIGGGLASYQAAKQLRERDAEATITLVSAEDHVPYDRPPLTKEFFRGEKPRKDILYEADEAYRQRRIDLLLGTSVQHLHLHEKTARLSNGRTIHFAKALLATGSRPVHLTIPGADLPGVHYLRTLDDAMAILAYVSAEARAVIIGAGFIGIELAASLTQLGVHVAVIETQPHIWSRFADSSLAEIVQAYCTGKGVTFRTSETVERIERHHDKLAVSLRSGVTLPCNFVCIGVGIVPNVELAQDAGLAVSNGVVVDEFMQTSHPDIYGAGDVINYVDPVFGKRRRVEHWGHAEYSGQLAGRNMAGGRDAYDLITYVWSDIFDLHLESAGDESEPDQVLVRGSLEKRSFSMLYLKDHRLRAYFSVNAGAKDLQPMQQLIRSKKDLSGHESQLQDPTVPVKTLLAKQ
jgi:NADPH-dependent 2,4-dienoyl-CoA reductase/sulfur reductase-like enzyme